MIDHKEIGEKLKVCESFQETGMEECDDFFDVTEDNLQLPYEEKLNIFKKDVETLYEFAISKNLSANQIRACLSPILGNKKSVGRRIASDSSKSLIQLSVIVATIAVLWAVPNFQNLIIVHAKLLSIKVS